MQELDSATVDYLAGELDAYLKLASAASLDNNCIDIAMVGRMVDSMKKLFKDFSHFSDEERMVISAAARYFLDSEDANQDFADRFGFDDDLAVLNAALLAISREDLLVTR